MTDNEIIKALGYCGNTECNDDCPLFCKYGCQKYLMTKTIDLIKRRQAEIERLKPENIMTVAISLDETEIREQLEKIKTQKLICIDNTESIRADAIKEFAEKLKESLTGWNTDPTDEEIEYVIDKLLKEVVGANNDR